VSEEKTKTFVARFTSVLERVFRGSGICVQSVTASFPKPPRPHKGSSRSLEDALDVSARCACRLALAVVREAELNEKLSCQGTAGAGQSKDGSNMLGWLAKLRSARGSSDKSVFSIPADFTAGDLLSPSWMQPWYLEARFSLSVVSVIRHALRRENWLRTQFVVLGRKLALDDSESQELTREGDEEPEQNEVSTIQEQAPGETDAILSEVLIGEIEDTDDEDESDMELLVSPSTEANVDQNAVGVVDMANLRSAKSPDCWNRHVFSELSDDEVDGRVANLLSPHKIEESRLTLEDFDLCLRSIGPEIDPVLPSGMKPLNHQIILLANSPRSMQTIHTTLSRYAPRADSFNGQHRSGLP